MLSMVRPVKINPMGNRAMIIGYKSMVSTLSKVLKNAMLNRMITSMKLAIYLFKTSMA